jgi:PAS domain S-box-containing protein
MQASVHQLERRLAEAEATIAALVSGQVDSVAGDAGPLLLAKAQAALRESEARLAITLHSIGDAVLATDLDGRVTRMNPVAEELTGWSAAEAAGRPVDVVLRVLSEGSRSPVPMPIAGLIARTATVAPQGQLVTRSGRERSIAQTAAPIRTPDDDVVGIVVAFRDVTEQRRMEAQLRLADRMVSMGTLAAGVAHEINNPLAALVGNLDALAAELSGGQRARVPVGSDAGAGIAELLQDAREAAERVRLIVQDLKLFSRAEEDRREIVVVPRVLESSVRLTWNEVRHRARLIKEFQPTPTVQANEARLGQVFVNLIVNAAHAIPEGRAENNEIRLRTGTDPDGKAIVEVHDTGIGIPPDVLPRIFDPFFTTKAVGSGTGLGLAICQRIVTELGGRISAESVAGKGTTFRVVLPASGAGRMNASTPSSSPPSLAARRARILVVDDEPLIQRAMTRLLSGDHDVTGETRAPDALARIAGGDRFDVIFCDVMMPQMTGIELYNRLAEGFPEQADRLVFLTGGAFTGGAASFLERSCRPVVNKPFDTRTVYAVIGELVAKP